MLQFTHAILIKTFCFPQITNLTYVELQRVHIEHDIGRLYMHCRRLQTEMRIGDEIPGIVFLNSLFLTNVLSCVYRGNETAQWYECTPPTLAEYLA